MTSRTPNGSGRRTRGTWRTGRRLGCRVAPKIVAAGDIVALPEGLTPANGPRRTPHWSAAIDQARTAAASLLTGDAAQPYTPAPYFWTEQWGLDIKICGRIMPGAVAETVEGSLADHSALIRYSRDGMPLAAASVNRRMPIVTLANSPHCRLTDPISPVQPPITRKRNKMTNLVEVADISLTSDDYLNDPFPTYDKVRDAGSAVYLPQYEAYAVGRYDAVRSVLGDWETFSSAGGIGLNYLANGATQGMIIATDPPRHDALREVLADRLSPRAIRALAGADRATGRETGDPP